jgi:hypothetical protein
MLKLQTLGFKTHPRLVLVLVETYCKTHIMCDTCHAQLSISMDTAAHLIEFFGKARDHIQQQLLLLTPEQHCQLHVIRQGHCCWLLLLLLLLLLRVSLTAAVAAASAIAACISWTAAAAAAAIAAVAIAAAAAAGGSAGASQQGLVKL